jgi:hypothetical protein
MEEIDLWFCTISSTIPLSPREQLYNRYCSNEQQFVPLAPQSPSPLANSFIIGTAVMNNNS